MMFSWLIVAANAKNKERNIDKKRKKIIKNQLNVELVSKLADYGYGLLLA